MALVEKGTAFEGITSSPDTQRCKAMYLAALGVECMGSVHVRKAGNTWAAKSLSQTD